MDDYFSRVAGRSIGALRVVWPMGRSRFVPEDAEAQFTWDEETVESEPAASSEPRPEPPPDPPPTPPRPPGVTPVPGGKDLGARHPSESGKRDSLASARDRVGESGPATLGRSVASPVQVQASQAASSVLAGAAAFAPGDRVDTPLEAAVDRVASGLSPSGVEKQLRRGEAGAAIPSRLELELGLRPAGIPVNQQVGESGTIQAPGSAGESIPDQLEAGSPPSATQTNVRVPDAGLIQMSVRTDETLADIATPRAVGKAVANRLELSGIPTKVQVRGAVGESIPDQLEAVSPPSGTQMNVRVPDAGLIQMSVRTDGTPADIATPRPVGDAVAKRSEASGIPAKEQVRGAVGEPIPDQLESELPPSGTQTNVRVPDAGLIQMSVWPGETPADIATPRAVGKAVANRLELSGIPTKVQVRGAVGESIPDQLEAVSPPSGTQMNVRVPDAGLIQMSVRTDGTPADIATPRPVGDAVAKRSEASGIPAKEQVREAVGESIPDQLEAGPPPSGTQTNVRVPNAGLIQMSVRPDGTLADIAKPRPVGGAVANRAEASGIPAKEQANGAAGEPIPDQLEAVSPPSGSQTNVRVPDAGLIQMSVRPDGTLADIATPRTVGDAVANRAEASGIPAKEQVREAAGESIPDQLEAGSSPSGTQTNARVPDAGLIQMSVRPVGTLADIATPRPAGDAAKRSEASGIPAKEQVNGAVGKSIPDQLEAGSPPSGTQTNVRVPDAGLIQMSVPPDGTLADIATPRPVGGAVANRSEAGLWPSGTPAKEQVRDAVGEPIPDQLESELPPSGTQTNVRVPDAGLIQMSVRPVGTLADIATPRPVGGAVANRAEAGLWPSGIPAKVNGAAGESIPDGAESGASQAGPPASVRFLEAGAIQLVADPGRSGAETALPRPVVEEAADSAESGLGLPGGHANARTAESSEIQLPRTVGAVPPDRVALGLWPIGAWANAVVGEAGEVHIAARTGETAADIRMPRSVGDAVPARVESGLWPSGLPAAIELSHADGESIPEYVESGVSPSIAPANVRVLEADAIQMAVRPGGTGAEVAMPRSVGAAVPSSLESGLWPHDIPVNERMGEVVAIEPPRTDGEFISDQVESGSAPSAARASERVLEVGAIQRAVRRGETAAAVEVSLPRPVVEAVGGANVLVSEAVTIQTASRLGETVSEVATLLPVVEAAPNRTESSVWPSGVPMNEQVEQAGAMRMPDSAEPQTNERVREARKIQETARPGETASDVAMLLPVVESTPNRAESGLWRSGIPMNEQVEQAGAIRMPHSAEPQTSEWVPEARTIQRAVRPGETASEVAMLLPLVEAAPNRTESSLWPYGIPMNEQVEQTGAIGMPHSAEPQASEWVPEARKIQETARSGETAPPEDAMFLPIMEAVPNRAESSLWPSGVPMNEHVEQADAMRMPDSAEPQTNERVREARKIQETARPGETASELAMLLPVVEAVPNRAESGLWPYGIPVNEQEEQAGAIRIPRSAGESIPHRIESGLPQLRARTNVPAGEQGAIRVAADPGDTATDIADPRPVLEAVPDRAESGFWQADAPDHALLGESGRIQIPRSIGESVPDHIESHSTSLRARANVTAGEDGSVRKAVSPGQISAEPPMPRPVRTAVPNRVESRLWPPGAIAKASMGESRANQTAALPGEIGADAAMHRSAGASIADHVESGSPLSLARANPLAGEARTIQTAALPAEMSAESALHHPAADLLRGSQDSRPTAFPDPAVTPPALSREQIPNHMESAPLRETNTVLSGPPVLQRRAVAPPPEHTPARSEAPAPLPDETPSVTFIPRRSPSDSPTAYTVPMQALKAENVEVVNIPFPPAFWPRKPLSASAQAFAPQAPASPAEEMPEAISRQLESALRSLQPDLERVPERQEAPQRTPNRSPRRNQRPPDAEATDPDESGDEPPSVHIQIGRIEIGNPGEPAPQVAAPPPLRPSLSLDEYLRRRDAGHL